MIAPRWLNLITLFAVLAPAPTYAATGPATLLKDINPHGTAAPRDFVSIGTTLFFSADDGVHGRELWKSDGTNAGTTMIKDIALGTTGALTSTHVLTDVNGTLFFAADDGVHGRELWKSNGTSAGTMLVKDIVPGADAGLQANDVDTSAQVANVHGMLFFGASGALWKSDGTEAGTIHVAAVTADKLAVVNNQLLFTSDFQLWQSDGTEAGTTLITALPYTPSCSRSYIDDLIVLKNRLFLTLVTPTEGKYGYCSLRINDVWVSDGTPIGTQRFQKDVYNLTVMRGALYYTDSTRLYKSDGIDPGVQVFQSPNAEDYSYNFYFNIRATADKLWLNFGDIGSVSGQWISDGTTGGTMMLTSLTSTYLITEVRTNLTLFAVTNATGRYDLWQTDGTTRGTHLAQNIAPSEILLVGGKVFLAADDTVHGSELWVAPLSAFGKTFTVALPLVES